MSALQLFPKVIVLTKHWLITLHECVFITQSALIQDNTQILVITSGKLPLITWSIHSFIHPHYSHGLLGFIPYIIEMSFNFNEIVIVRHASNSLSFAIQLTINSKAQTRIMGSSVRDVFGSCLLGSTPTGFSHCKGMPLGYRCAANKIRHQR